jgi:hypothetical protein
MIQNDLKIILYNNIKVCSLSLVNNWVIKTTVITTENVKSKPLLPYPK